MAFPPYDKAGWGLELVKSENENSLLDSQEAPSFCSLTGKVGEGFPVLVSEATE